jgi:uncharacterized membrane protein
MLSPGVTHVKLTWIAAALQPYAVSYVVKKHCYEWAGEVTVQRNVVLYLATLLVLIPIDFLFLGLVTKGFFTAKVGDMLGEIRPAPTILFYLLYLAGILIFVCGSREATWQLTLLYGALFGLFCYATFELTSLSLLKHWAVVAADVSWGTFVTALAATAGYRSRIGSRREVNLVIPGRCKASNPESRDSESGATAPSRNDGLDCFAWLAIASRHFGCGTIRIYGFGDFQPCG